MPSTGRGWVCGAFYLHIRQCKRREKKPSEKTDENINTSSCIDENSFFFLFPKKLFVCRNFTIAHPAREKWDSSPSRYLSSADNHSEDDNENPKVNDADRNQRVGGRNEKKLCSLMQEKHYSTIHGSVLLPSTA